MPDRRIVKRVTMNGSTGIDGLPGYFSALRLACRCFGVGLPQMTKALEWCRKREKKPDRHFPRRLTRTMLNRAAAGFGRWGNALEIIAYEALYHRLLREDGQSSATAHFAENLTNGLLRLYQRMLPRLRVTGIPAQRALKILIEEVFLPTVFLELKKARGRALGTEFGIKTCWYLPKKEKGSRTEPFPVVLKYWMNAAGFRYAEDIGKATSDSERKKVQGWLNDEHMPTPAGISKLVNRFADDARKIDTPESWKGRLGLAAATQKLSAAMDGFFADSGAGACLTLFEVLQRLDGENIAIDDDHILFETHTFFAARLLQKRWMRTGEWENKVKSASRDLAPPPSADATDEEFTRYSRDTAHRLNPGNCFLQQITSELADGSLGNPSIFEGAVFVEEFIFALGIEEINALMEAERVGGP